MTNDTYPVIPEDCMFDLHNLEYADMADLVLFMAGNQFMVMEELVNAFQLRNPTVKRVFYETLPPGLELKQILAGGAIFEGKPLTVRPDVYSSVNAKAMDLLAENGHIDRGDAFVYLHNRLTLMTQESNPAGITSIHDLAKEKIRISQPDPDIEDIAQHIINMYRQAGGDELVNRIMVEKKANGTTRFTTVHHRDTPSRLFMRNCDVGPVWATELVHAWASGYMFGEVLLGEKLDQRHNINYYICKMKNAAHPENADKFLHFIRTEEGRDIYQRHGFPVHREK